MGFGLPGVRFVPHNSPLRGFEDLQDSDGSDVCKKTAIRRADSRKRSRAFIKTVRLLSPSAIYPIRRALMRFCRYTAGVASILPSAGLL